MRASSVVKTTGRKLALGKRVLAGGKRQSRAWECNSERSLGFSTLSLRACSEGRALAGKLTE